MPTKSWSDFFLYLVRVLILLILLAVVLPKLMAVCNIWMSSFLHNEQKPLGNPLRVEAPEWSKLVFQSFLPSRKK